MKRALQLSVLILLYILLSAKSCSREEEYNANREEKAAGSAKDSILAVFGSENPTILELTAYEETARERFSDFLDYSDILADTLMADAFRDQAATMLRGLFVSGSNIPRMQISRPSAVRVVSGLQPVSDTLYQGKLGFTSKTEASDHSPGYNLEGVTMDFYLVKLGKPFGSDTLKVWTVLLGDIR